MNNFENMTNKQLYNKIEKIKNLQDGFAHRIDCDRLDNIYWDINEELNNRWRVLLTKAFDEHILSDKVINKRDCVSAMLDEVDIESNHYELDKSICKHNRPVILSLD